MNKPESLERYPVDCFKKEFSVEKDIKKARLYITACGVYEAKINGKRVGNFYLAPGITDYTKRVQYQTYDVSELIENGSNEINVQLADGWYRGYAGAWGLKQEYSYETKLLAQLRLCEKRLKNENGRYIYEIEIPANCTADLILPDGKKETLHAGTYKFTE